MDDIAQFTVENVTLESIGNNPNQYPEEVIGAALEVMINMERRIREIKGNMTVNIIARMQKDNATKLLFCNTRGEERTLTIKSPTPKLNANIKNYEAFILKSGFAPEQLGEIKFVPYGWGVMKEKRKQLADIQLLIDELYVAGNPSIEIK